MTKKFILTFAFVIVYLFGYVTPGFLTILIAQPKKPNITRTIHIIPYATVAPATPTPRIIYPTTTPTPTPTQEVSSNEAFYLVGSGETLSEISRKTGVSVYDLVRINSIDNINKVNAGQVLMLKSRDEILKSAYAEKGKKVIVILSEQKAYALEDDKVIKTFIVSTGIAAYPTVLGRYPIYIKLESTTMSGPGYYLENVPYTMYFFQSYGLHGTYWHHNFGTPMSHGCVNMKTEDAHWVFDWAIVGTPVWVIQ